MKKRVLQKRIAKVISALVIAIFFLSSFFVIYTVFDRNERNIKQMQKEVLANLKKKIDETIQMSSLCISKGSLDESVIKFLEDETTDLRNLSLASNAMTEQNFLFRDTDCIFGIVKPGSDDFLTNVGLVHSFGLKREYNFPDIFIDLVKNPQDSAYVNGYYLSEELPYSEKRLNLLVRQDATTPEISHIQGFISINVSSLINSDINDTGVFYVYNNGKCVFSSSGSFEAGKSVSVEDSELVHGLSFGYVSHKKTGVLNIVLLSVVVLLFVYMGLFLSKYLSRFLYKPIDNIVSAITNSDENSIFDEEKYISMRFKESNDLQVQYSADLKNIVMRNILMGTIDEKVIAKYQNERILSNMLGEIHLASFMINYESADFDSSQITKILKSIIGEAEIVYVNPSNIVVILRNMTFENAKTIIMKAVLELTALDNLDAVVALAQGNISKLEEFNKLYIEATGYLQMSEYGSKKLILTKEDVIIEKEFVYYPIEIEKIIIDNTLSNNCDFAFQHLSKILRKNLTEKQLKKEELVELKFMLIGTFKRICQLINRSEEDLFGDDKLMYYELELLQDKQEIIEKINEIYGKISCYVMKSYNDSTEKLISKIEQYVCENYQRTDMSLDLLGSVFNVTPGYISKLFRKYKRVNFKEYLACYRVEKATGILQSAPDVKNDELAKMVGYSNISSLTRNFKQLKNVSIKEYKRDFVNGGEKNEHN